jgi:quinol-cytochrome oxidoreductase complex cytochrome b subunit
VSEREHGSWTGAVRERALAALPPEKLLPDTQPAYMSSWIYVFGVLSLVSLVLIIASGMILSLQGPDWWHTSGIGHFFNSFHLWSVELFFFFMVIHLWGKYWMAAWRGGRSRTWMTGAVSFLVAIPCALTGYVSQQNFDSQWISTQAKDALNAAGIGSFWNLMNFGQMYTYHVLLLPLAVIALVAAHVLLVRKHGIVPPFALSGVKTASTSVPDLSQMPAPSLPPEPASGHSPEPVPAPALSPVLVPGHGPGPNGAPERNEGP